jgi:hypothetical protein
MRHHRNPNHSDGMRAKAAPSLRFFAPRRKSCSTPGTAAFRLRALAENPGARSRDGFHHGLLAVLGVLPSRGLRRDHLANLPDAALAVRPGLAAVLDLPHRARATADLFGDAAVGDTLADADEHDGYRLISVLKFVFNSVLGYSEDAPGAQELNLSVEIAEISPVCIRSRVRRENGAVNAWLARAGRCRVFRP